MAKIRETAKFNLAKINPVKVYILLSFLHPNLFIVKNLTFKENFLSNFLSVSNKLSGPLQFPLASFRSGIKERDNVDPDHFNFDHDQDKKEARTQNKKKISIIHTI